MEPQLSINIRKTNMKDTKQIIDDCGIADTRAGSFLADIVSRKFTPFHAAGAIEETMGEIIGALYRRIEKLEGYEAGYRATLSKILLWLDDLGYGNSSLSIADNILQTLGEQRARIEELEEEKECHIAEIKALESAVAGNAERIVKLEEENASFIKDLKLQSERLAELETWNGENQGV